MKKLFAASLVALMSVAGSAQAAPTITFNGGSGTLPSNVSVFQNFDNVPSGTSIGVNAIATTAGARPAFGSSNNFATVFSGGIYSVGLGNTNVFSFVLGSLDVFNTLTLAFSDGTSMAYNGGAIVNSPTLFDSGNRTDAQTNGVVTFTANAGQLLSSATFTTSGDAFEFDNLAAAAVPEPAAWGMMILGFGLVGGVLRRRPSAAKLRLA